MEGSCLLPSAYRLLLTPHSGGRDSRAERRESSGVRGEEWDLIGVVRVGADAEAEVVGADRVRERDDDQPTDRRAEQRPGDEALEDAIEAVRELGEEHAGEPERDGGGGDLGGKRPLER